ncbi:MAG: outer membrane beta-barrel protein [Bryobacterales bacterium]|nr:outer membrane beta-barrel protein [Bryobacterales bacterium]MBV9399906.1 outer membrane beta-barrel protein [Bryobacterales bacterium]
MKASALAACSLFVIGTASAQEFQHVLVDFGAGFTSPVSRSADHLDMGWNVQGGIGYNFSPVVGAKLQLDYNSMGIKSSVLNNIGVPGGNVNIFSATVNPIVHLIPHSHFDIYAIGGGGLYHRTQEFTAPTIQTFTGFNPFFGFFYPVGVPANQVLASYTVNKPGINGGMGIAFGPRARGKFFAEARWTRIFLTSSIHTDYVPVSFGFRW